MMKDKSVIIADGHHRYTTALTYARENPNPAAKYQMLAFANVRQQGLVILATHRLVANLKNFSPDRFLASLKSDFEVTEYRFDSDSAKADAKAAVFAQMKQHYAKGKNAFGIYSAGNRFMLAVLKNTHAMDAVAPQMSPPWRSLDVSVLMKLILEKLLGIGEKELAEGSHVRYAKDIGNAVDESIEQVDRGQTQLVFLLNPTRMHQVEQVTTLGERMPQKSTYFYPKIFTGLTISRL
jgi:uncharacterized protein (DUF1015 family)